MKPVSKSQFILSLQCDKAFWLYRHQKEHLQHSASQQKIMQQGTDFGILMQGLFPGGVDVSEATDNFNDRIELTLDLIGKGDRPIYEATLSVNVAGVPLLCMIDMLVPAENGWHIYEVKSSTSVKDTYIADAGFQKYIAEQIGLQVLSVNIVYVNNTYVRNGSLDIRELGTIANISQQMATANFDFDQQLEDLQSIDIGGKPETDIGAHCLNPYPCGFKDHCWSHLPAQDSVFDLFPAGKAFELYDGGYTQVDKIPSDYSFTGLAKKRFDAFKSGRGIFDFAQVQRFLGEVRYPISFMDFETFTSAVPLFDQSRPYQQICFQYSVHIQTSPEAELQHKEFLALAEAGDPRRGFMENLIRDMPNEGSVIVYNATFEKQRMMELAALFPEYRSSCDGIIERIVDLLTPFRKLHVYTPDMKGSASIKSVLPALVPGKTYEGMDISQGGEAMEIYANMVNGNYNADETEKHRNALLAYCKQDTLAMVKLMDVLKQKLAEHSS